MVNRRPHTLTFNWTTPSYLNGKSVSGAPSSLTIQCRYVPQGPKLTRNASGDWISINYKIYTDPLTSVIPENAYTIVKSKRFNVIEVFNYQTYTCIWL